MNDGRRLGSRARAAPHRYCSVAPTAITLSAVAIEPIRSRVKRLCSVIRPSVFSLTLTWEPPSWMATARISRIPAAAARAVCRLRTRAS